MITVFLGDETYTVDASYEFSNRGLSRRLPVGFPAYSSRYVTDAVKATFSEFQAWVDGKKISVQERPGPVKEWPPMVEGWSPVREEIQWLAADVNFPEGNKVAVRFRYSAPYDRGEIYQGMSFLHGLAGGWAGTIEASSFVVRTAPGVCIQGDGVSFFGRETGEDRIYPVGVASDSEMKFLLPETDFPSDEIFYMAVLPRGPGPFGRCWKPQEANTGKNHAQTH